MFSACLSGLSLVTLASPTVQRHAVSGVKLFGYFKFVMC